MQVALEGACAERQSVQPAGVATVPPSGAEPLQRPKYGSASFEKIAESGRQAESGAAS